MFVSYLKLKTDTENLEQTVGSHFTNTTIFKENVDEIVIFYRVPYLPIV